MLLGYEVYELFVEPCTLYDFFSGITWGVRYLFWYPFISSEGGRGGTDGVRVVGGWLLTLLATGLDVRLVFHCEVVVSTNVTAHRSDSIFSRK